MKITKNSTVLIIGQYLTSRTEALRDFVIPRVKITAVIALGSAFIDKKENHLFLYEYGSLKRHCVFRHGLLKRIKSRELLILTTFVLYAWDIIRALFVLRMRFDVFLGVSHFSGLLGVLLKSLGICKMIVYYAIDYYAPCDSGNKFINALIKVENFVDKMSVLYSDEVWDISPRIAEGRQKFGSLDKKHYGSKNKIVPLGYSKNFFRNKDIHGIDRYSIVFVGVITEGQGIELLVDILPRLQKVIPAVNVKIIGTGYSLPNYKELAAAKGLKDLFKFYGFIEDETTLLDLISSSAVGISLWDYSLKRNLNSYFGDSGKTKLYSVCGLPVIVSNSTIYAQVISQHKAGIAINYNQKELIEALSLILRDDRVYYEYKNNAVRTALDYCDSEKIFSGVLT